MRIQIGLFLVRCCAVCILFVRVCVCVCREPVHEKRQRCPSANASFLEFVPRGSAFHAFECSKDRMVALRGIVVVYSQCCYFRLFFFLDSSVALHYSPRVPSRSFPRHSALLCFNPLRFASICFDLLRFASFRLTFL